MPCWTRGMLNDKGTVSLMSVWREQGDFYFLSTWRSLITRCFFNLKARLSSSATFVSSETDVEVLKHQKSFQWKTGVNYTCVNSKGTDTESISKYYEWYCRPNVALCVRLMPLKTHWHKSLIQTLPAKPEIKAGRLSLTVWI